MPWSPSGVVELMAYRSRYAARVTTAWSHWARSRRSTGGSPRRRTQGALVRRASLARSRARCSMRSRRSSRACRMSGAIGPSASGMSPTMRRVLGARRPRGWLAASATRWRRTAATSSASSSPCRARTAGRSRSTEWPLASARRSSAASGPNASELMATSACSGLRPEARISVAQRSRWAAAAMVSYSAASWAMDAPGLLLVANRSGARTVRRRCCARTPGGRHAR